MALATTSPARSTPPSTRDRADLTAARAKIHANPELRFEETKAGGLDRRARRRARAIAVERGVGGMPTAFRARAGAAAGPRVAILAEYDALPGDRPRLRAQPDRRRRAGRVPRRGARRREGSAGEVVLLGTPAEEGGGGKIRLLEAGAFDGRRRGDDVPPLRPRPPRAPRARVALARPSTSTARRPTPPRRRTTAAARSPPAWTRSASSTGSACTSATACACTAS